MSEYLKEPLWNSDDLAPLFNLMRDAASPKACVETLYDRFVSMVGQYIPADASERQGSIIGATLEFEMFSAAPPRSAYETDSDERYRAGLAKSLAKYRAGARHISPIASRAGADMLLLAARNRARDSDVAKGAAKLWAERLRRGFPFNNNMSRSK